MSTYHPSPSRKAGGLLRGLRTLAVCTLAASLGALSSQAQIDYEETEERAYGYFRVVEGDAILTQGDDGSRDEAERHQPVLAGDRLEVEPSARVEILLSDWNVLRLDGGTDLLFHRLANSPDTEDRETRLELLRGNLQILVAADASGEEAPSVETLNATVYLHRDGVYRIATHPSGWTEVVVRSGFAEVLSREGSAIVRAGEAAVVEGRHRVDTQVARAGRRDSLERWGEDLDARALEADPYVDDRLRYAAAPLDDHGSWVTVEGRRAWRPYADPDWRPYWNGRWVYTPSGLSWVSSEPWGWVPYHYGTWDLVRGFGWVWFPGRRFSVAHVHWYWGPEYVAWYPSGYYNRYYSRHFGFGIRFGHGVFGYAGGRWDPFDDWFFCPPRYLGHRRQSYYLRRGHRVRRDHGHRELPHGFITTDTRDLTPERWRDHDRVREVLRRRPRGDDARPGDRRLPDVTAFIAREPELTPEVLERLKEPEPLARRRPPRGTDGQGGRLGNTSAVLGSPRDEVKPGLRSPEDRPSKPAEEILQPRNPRRDQPRVYSEETPRKPDSSSPLRPQARNPRDAERWGETDKPRGVLRDEPRTSSPRERRQPADGSVLENKPSVRRVDPQRPARIQPRTAPRVRTSPRREPTREIEKPRESRPTVQTPRPRRVTPRERAPKESAPSVRSSPRTSYPSSERRAAPRRETKERPQIRNEVGSRTQTRAPTQRRPTVRSSSPSPTRPKVESTYRARKPASTSASGRGTTSRSRVSNSGARSRPSRSSASSSRSSERRKSSPSVSTSRSRPQRSSASSSRSSERRKSTPSASSSRSRPSKSSASSSRSSVRNKSSSSSRRSAPRRSPSKPPAKRRQ